ncbi:single-strand binding protein [Marinobacter nauticus]|uniref:Single-stranded DNA-binding protein n=1 Tax=Marinobacter nauticus TaxID=2743 RepID=A0A368X851_MARNT|nr:single-stranded DNA-binding protein [Marinobacter nauticus]RCW64005.1 single-strand binding protein [Marinobacter nauticus]|tara:strand:+ start:1916 stop:2368 length:453 start_codon:yes stop_codon:yes gene_type:complete
MAKKSSFNQVILMGNIGNDPEPRSTPNGTQIVNLRLATDDSYKDRKSGQWVEHTDWHSVTLIGKVAEIASRYLSKGDQILVKGKLKTRKWESENGEKRSITEVVVDFEGTMQMLGGKGQKNPQQGPGDQPPAPAGEGAPNPEDWDDDVPF